MQGAKEKVEGNSFQSITKLIVLERLDRDVSSLSAPKAEVRLKQIKWAELNFEYDHKEGRKYFLLHQRLAIQHLDGREEGEHL